MADWFNWTLKDWTNIHLSAKYHCKPRKKDEIQLFRWFPSLIFADWTKNNTKSNKKRNNQQIIQAKVVSDISLGCGWYFLQTI
ncbi:hypothetical protein AUL54_08035 [Bacillus sp. SDLI1]|nr:hypothetical protein AUL54_08035 [Bacillus sp. SDLI1]